uniref:Small ribosomal subunit protein mS33 n=1 Tax=Globodera rostochiensis TaxID=31243 RepID=A0A914H0X8_GLORO
MHYFLLSRAYCSAKASPLALTQELVSRLERLSALRMQLPDDARNLTDDIRLAERIFNVDTKGVNPLYNVSEDCISCPLRNDVPGPTSMNETLANARKTFEGKMAARTRTIKQLMSGPLVRVACPTNRLLNERTEYGRRMKRLSHRIFGEVTLQADKKTMRVAEIMAAEPWEQQAKLSEKYYPNTPMFHYLVKMLKMHGLFFDEHLVWREVQNEIRIAKGKIIHPPIGAGKQKTKGKI